MDDAFEQVPPHHPLSSSHLTSVVMAKPAVPGRVKTRLQPELTPEQSAAVHAAMMACVLQRVMMHLPGRHVLALASESPTAGAGAEVEIPPGWRVVGQGEGDLGARLERVWREVSPAGPVVFLGVDSPDVPAEALGDVALRLGACDGLVGPVDDGGYWTLAAQRFRPQLVRDIDWGTPAVYHQTRVAAERAGLTLGDLPPWYDVDTPADLQRLQQRLSTATEPPLRQLCDRLRALRSP